MTGEACSSRMSKKIAHCEVCNAQNAAIYTCPKCELRTCSLSCVNIHKKELDCDGVRDKTKFIYKPDYGTMDLFNDYKLLEETNRFLYGAQRDKTKRFTAFNRDLPLFRHKLKCAARKRGTVLFFLLENFTRHRINATRLNFKQNKIYWLVEWVFVNANPSSMTIRESKCDEDLRLAKLIEKYFNPDPDCDANNKGLEFYHSSGTSNCRFLLKAERVKNCSKKYHELDVRLSLKENLAGKCIIEFPTIYVILKDHSYDLNIVDSDEEIEHSSQAEKDSNDLKETESRIEEQKQPTKESFTVTYAKRQKLQIQNEIADMQKKQPKNFLFASEYSSEEDV